MSYTPLRLRRLLRGRRPTQPIAALMAAVYVVLCTFGSLTHTHALAEPDSPQPQQATLSTASAASTASTASTAGAASAHAAGPADWFTAPFRCAWCEWQANTVSCALPILRIAPPPPDIPTSVAHRPTYHAVFLPLPASRAPPLA